MQKYIELLQKKLIPLLPNTNELSLRHPRRSITIIYEHFAHDSLYRNSIYLMLSTGVMSFFGFFFWYISAKLFTPKEIGYATAIISIVNLLASLSIFGLDGGLVRFLPKSKHKNGKITLVISIILLASIVLSIVYLLNLQIFSPKLLFIKQNAVLFLSFIIFVAVTAVNNITNSIFIAYRSSKYCFITNAVFSIVKVLLPIATVSLGSVGICLSVLIGIAISLILSFFILMYKFNYRYDFTVNKVNTRHMYSFAIGSYVSGLIGGLPMQILPIIIINKLRPEVSAYFYIDMMIIGLLYMIPISTVQSFFAESSFNEDQIKENVIKVSKMIVLLVIPSIIIAFIGGKYLLLLFGKSYSIEGVGFLQLMTLSTLFVSVNYVWGAIFRIKGQIKDINIIVSVGSIITLFISYLMISHELYGIGMGLIGGQIAVMICYTARFFLIKHHFINENTTV